MGSGFLGRRISTPPPAKIPSIEDWDRRDRHHFRDGDVFEFNGRLYRWSGAVGDALPIGVPTPAVPDFLPGVPMFWYRASSEVLPNSPTSPPSVANPQNFGDGGVFATQGESSARPVVEEGSFYNFDGSDYWSLGGHPTSLEAMTVLWAAEGGSSSDDPVYVQNESGAPVFLTRIDGSVDEPAALLEDSNGNTSDLVSPTVAGSDPHVAAARFSFSTNVLRVWADGGSGITDDADTSPGWTDGALDASTATIGYRPGSSTFQDGRVWTVLGFSTYLSDSETTTALRGLADLVL